VKGEGEGVGVEVGQWGCFGELGCVREGSAEIYGVWKVNNSA
jgi:hypothetical protein